jgi:hypothetical protein
MKEFNINENPLYRWFKKTSPFLKFQIMRYNSACKCLWKIIFNFNFNFNFKTVHLTVSQNVVTMVGTLVLKWNRILSPLDRLDVSIRSIRSPN